MRDLFFFPGCICPLTKKPARPGPPIKTGLELPLLTVRELHITGSVTQRDNEQEAVS